MKLWLGLAAAIFFTLWWRGRYRLVAQAPPAARDEAAESRGEHVFLREGCYGCHAVSEWPSLPPPGPALANVRSKLSREFIYTWLARPQSYRPYLRVSSHFLRDDSEAGVRALTAYILNRSRPWGQSHLQTRPGGDALYAKLACSACHGDLDQGFTNIGAKTTGAWLSAYLRAPAAYDAQTTMPDFRLSANDADAIATTLSVQNDGIFELHFPHLTRQTVEAVDDALNAEGIAEVKGVPLAEALLADKEVALGELRYAQAGCGGCHGLAPRSDAATATTRDAMPAPEGALAAMSRTGTHVQFALTPDEQSDLAAFLRRPARAKLTPEEVGELRMRTLGCATCHETQRAPSLANEGARARPEWLFAYLAKPYKTDKTQGMVMPTFAMSDETMNDIVRVLAAPRVEFETAPTARGSLADCKSCHDAAAFAAMRAHFRPSYVQHYLSTHPRAHDEETAAGLTGAIFADLPKKDAP